MIFDPLYVVMIIILLCVKVKLSPRDNGSRCLYLPRFLTDSKEIYHRVTHRQDETNSIYNHPNNSINDQQ